MQVQQFRGPTASNATLLLGDRAGAFIEHEPDGCYSMSAMATAEAPRLVARFLGFDPAPRVGLRRALGLAPVVLDEFHARLTQGDGPAAAATLGPGRELSGPELSLLLDLVDGRCHSWRLLTPEASVVVVDGGDRGMWRSGTAADGRYDHEFVPTTPGDLTALLAVVLHPPMPAVHAA